MYVLGAELVGVIGCKPRRAFDHLYPSQQVCQTQLILYVIGYVMGYVLGRLPLASLGVHHHFALRKGRLPKPTHQRITCSPIAASVT